MKKTILAIAIPVLFASAANAAVVYDKEGTKLDVFGRVQANFYGDSDNSPSMQERNAGIDGSARLGLDASVALSDSWSAFAYSELQLSENDAVGNNGESSYVRHLYAGFHSKDFGRILFGQTDTPFYDITEFTDIFNDYGTAGHYDRGRASGQIIYNAKLFAHDLVDMKAGIQFDEDNSNMAGTLSAIMNFNESFKMGAAIDYVDHKTLDTAMQFGLSASYLFDDLYMAVLVTTGDVVVDNYLGQKVGKATGYELVGAYTMDSWRFLGGYGQVMHDQDDFGYEDADDKKQATMGAEYYFTKNLMGYAEYAIKPNDDIYTVAVQYNF